MHRVKAVQSRPLWKRVLLAILIALGKCLDKFFSIFPSPKHKQLNRYSRNKLLIHTNYIEVVESRRWIISGMLYAVFITGIWVYLSVVNYSGFGSLSDSFVTLIHPLNAVLMSLALRSHARVAWAFMFKTPVLIGDTDNDQKAEDLAHAMQDAADAKKIKMVLIKQGRDMRAYFRNDDEAVLVRASS